MPGSEYTSASGGVLKLKGQAGVDKKRKKKKRHDAPDAKGQPSASAIQEAFSDSIQRALADEDAQDEGQSVPEGEVRSSTTGSGEQSSGRAAETLSASHLGKTEAERKYEERRRKRLDERLKREGLKTHKERVEELNRYLSNLSEHHDMPRIGPG